MSLPTIGFLGASTPAAWSEWTAAFVQRLLPKSAQAASNTFQLQFERCSRQSATQSAAIISTLIPIARQLARYGLITGVEQIAQLPCGTTVCGPPR
jgi:hypothetical protein